MLVINGLGRGAFGNNFPTKAGGGAHVSPTDPSKYIEPTGPIGYTSFGISTLWINYLTKIGTRTWATIGAIRETGKITTPYPAQSLVGCKYQRQIGYTDILNPPGVINVFGVPFTVDELQAGKLERTLVPNEEQRFLIDYAIYVRSQAVVANMIRMTGTSGGGCGTAWGSAGQYASLQPAGMERNPAQLVFAALDARMRTSSIRKFISVCPEDQRLTTWIEGYSFNPIQPTAEELDGDHGLVRYYERGGFLLSPAAAEGRAPIDRTGTRGLHWGVGYYLCPRGDVPLDSTQGGNAKATPEDYAGGVPVPALFYHTAEGVGWDVFATIGPEYTIRVVPADPGVGQKILKGMATVMTKLREVLCAVLPLAQPIAQQQLLAELCVDSFGNPCKKGTPGCTCTPPTPGQKDAYSASMALANKVCTMGPTPGGGTPMPPPQQISPPDEGRVEPKGIPWWAIVLGGIGVGALAFSARGRR